MSLNSLLCLVLKTTLSAACFVFSAACSQAVETPSLNAAVGNGYFSRCQPGESGTLLPVAPRMQQRAGTDRICVSRKDVLAVGSSLRFVPSREGLNQLILQCDGQADAFLRRKSGGRVTLVIGGVVFDELIVVADGSRQACSVQLGSDMWEAFEYCEAAATALGHSAQGCQTPCSGKESVCIPVKWSRRVQ